MKLTPEVIGRDLNAKVEKVMRLERKTWGEAVVSLIHKVVSPAAPTMARRKTGKAKPGNFFGRKVVSPRGRKQPAA